jgi:hypothetical protein
MPVLAEAFLSPGSVQKSVSKEFQRRKGICLAMEMPFASARHLAKNHPARFPRFHSYQSQVLSRLPFQ